MKAAGSLVTSLFSALLGFIGPVQATEWEIVQKLADGTVREIDRDSVVEAGQIVKVWVRADYTNKRLSDAETANELREKELAARGILSCGGVTSPFCQAGQNKVSYDKDYLAFNCEKREIAVLASIAYRGDGSVIKSANWTKEKPSFTMVVPDTIGEKLLKKICPSIR